MTSTTPRRRTRAAATALLAAIAVAGLSATSASAAAGMKFDQRTGGNTRVETAIASSKALYPTGGSEDVVLVNLTRTVDGLSASYLAGLKNAPVLYTDIDATPQATRDELKRLGVKRVWLVGGTSVISSSLEKLIAADYQVKRYAGDDRYGTACRGRDRWAVRPGARLHHLGLVAGRRRHRGSGGVGQQLPDPAHQGGLRAEGDQRRAGQARASPTAPSSAAPPSSRTARTRPSGPPSDWRRRPPEHGGRVAEDAVATANFTFAGAALVGGKDTNAVDALSASALAGYHGVPILYTATPDDIGAPTANYLKKHAANLTGPGFVFGGTSAISDKAVGQANGASQ